MSKIVTVLHASENWLRAREELLELTVSDPAYATCLNALSNAEDALARAVREIRKEPKNEDFA